jgi:hypothetical protein
MTNPKIPHDVEELLGAYALDAVDSIEREAVDQHLAVCPRCRAELHDFREVAAMLAYEGAPAPDDVWTRIVSSLEEEPPPLRVPIEPDGRAGVAVVSLAERRAPRGHRLSWALAGAAAAVVVMLVGALVARALDDPASSPSDQERSELAGADLERAANRALVDPANTTAVLQAPTGAVEPVTAVLTGDGTGFLLTPELASLPADRTYQLWGIVGDRVISLGVLGAAPSTSVFEVDPAAPLDGLAITEEVAGGVVASQNDPTLVWTA